MTKPVQTVAERNGKPSRLRARYGEWALVTGASDGIGAASARALARAGLSLVLAARRADRLDALAASLERAHRTPCRVVPVDLGRPEGPRLLLDAVAGLDVGLAVLAAGFGTSGPFLASALPDELDMVDLNCRAVAELAHGLGGAMAARGRGGLVLLSSIVAFQGVARSANYAATKAYVQVLGEGLAEELAPSGVDVLVAAPGPVATGFAARAGMTMAGAAQAGPVAEAILAALGRRTMVRPGAQAKLLGWSLGTLPRALRTRVMGRIMAGMTGG